jgi:hypothetical protein
LSTGMSAQCAWNKNHATLQGRMIFYNNNKIVRISKTKVKTKNLGAGKPAQTIPSDQGLYQLLWDDLDR